MIVFAVRGDSQDARYSTGYPKGIATVPSLVTVTADAGALSGSRIDMTNTGVKNLVWPSNKNSGESRASSFLMRVKAAYTGSPAASRSYFMLGVGRSSVGPYREMWHDSATGHILMFSKNESNATVLNSTSGTYYDLVFTTDGTAGSNAAKFYIDGSLLGQVTPSAALASSWLSEYFSPIAIGAAQDVTSSAFSLDELVIWDSVIDPTSVALVSGNGSLNGASRTSLVNVAAVNGSAWDVITAAQIKTGITQTQAGIANL